LSLRAGLIVQAGQLVNIGLKTSSDAETQARFVALQAKLPVTPTPSP
jgi:hypothetical protein